MSNQTANTGVEIGSGDEQSSVESNCCETACRTSTNKDVTYYIKKLLTPWSAIALISASVFMLDRFAFSEFFTIASASFIATLPFIVFAVLMIAYLKSTGAESLVAKAFDGRENRMILLAAVFGGLAPFCSCEVIPFISGLLAIGIPLPAVMAFWLSSPLIDPPALIITASALGWPFAIGKSIIAVGLGLLGGFGIKALMRHSSFASPLKSTPLVGTCCTAITSSGVQWRFWEESQRRQTFIEQMKENIVFLVKWLMFAYVLEALLILYIPAEVISQIVGGDGLFSVIVGAAVGMPAYLNGYAAPALIAGFINQGMTTGAAMAFMTAGAISSIPAMTAVWSLVKKEVFIAYLTIGFVGSVLFGWVFGVLI
ncbi:permease [Marinomonas aquiplantarum]|uniref:Permease n=1 Tax=Marinomonas aquiplantarum TaxID=491951 RepID=A0A366CXF6_9GAMM|nr:permease [Marinomonas aquiplantarum]RBO80151.1 hypothetical protein DFP76_10814 [Marinomonas aquiplantarum]